MPVAFEDILSNRTTITAPERNAWRPSVEQSTQAELATKKLRRTHPLALSATY
jgi:hypothetical protein